MTDQATVLVVDDDPSILAICADLLESEGYTVLCARDGRQALAIVRQDKPTAVLTDIMMPLMDGITMCREVKADPGTAHVPVALMSARTNLTRHNQELACADAIVSKPFDIDQLLDTVQRLLPEDIAP
jgi:CheY-like chemotaxis protein